MFNDPLAAALSKIMNAERVGKREVLIKPASKLLKEVLNILNEHNYLGTFEEIDDEKGGVLKVNILGNVNKCGAIKPRFSTKHNNFEKWEKRYLPAKDFGLLIVSTPLGIMAHNIAKEKKTGGKLLAYCY
ncbi:30S ribosomal protein S8 [Candidatus Woesearchaeota archaeon]|nr:30S ribosomal protein S8 [Candidatus Woesearchaeota archaeon]